MWDMTVRRLLPSFLIGLVLVGCDAASPSEGEETTEPVVPTGKADGIENGETYGQMAATRVMPLLDEVVTGVEIFDEDIQPHEAKALRKTIGRLRDMVDIFVYAYPDDDGDLWQDIRESLDEGYESMGAFKDLFDVQGVEAEWAEYDEEEVAELRDVVLAWKREFMDPDTQRIYGEYLASPSLTEIHERDDDDLPRFYWKESGKEPKDDLTGLENMQRLTRELIDEARDDLDKTEDLRKLHKEKNQHSFHDFRKRLRSVEKLSVYFPEMYAQDDPERLASLLLLVETTVDLYGDINDKLVAHMRAHERDDDDREEELEDEIKSMWKNLRDFQDDEDVDDELKDLRRMIPKP